MWTFERTHEMPATPAVIWPVIADLEGYGEATTSLSKTEIVGGGEGEGAVRRCYDRRGGTWQETCTLWEEGVRYTMEVDTSTYPALLRRTLRTFKGTWSVAPEGEDRGLVTARFDAESRGGPLGWLMLRFLDRVFERETAATFEAWEEKVRETAPGNPG